MNQTPPPLSAHANASMNNRAIDSSLSKLNSGFRINSAADDASGMAIADSLRSQASSLGKAIMNANDAIGIIQTADKAMDEQIKILETIKNKAIQSAQDGQTTETRKALQADISRLMEELDNIGNTTSFNGQKLLSGTFSNKEFQIGAYSNETVKASIGATTSDKIGLTRFETGHNVRAADLANLDDGNVTITFKNVDGINDITLEPVKMADKDANNRPVIKAGQGLGALAEAINKASDKTGVKASVTTETVFAQTIKAGSTTEDFTINGVKIGKIEVKDKDGNGALRAAINSVKDQTGVEASVDSKGRLVLNNRDGRGINITDGTFGTPTQKLTDAANAVIIPTGTANGITGIFDGAGAMTGQATAANGLDITNAITNNAANTDSYSNLKQKLEGQGQFDIISKTAEQEALNAMAGQVNNQGQFGAALGLDITGGLTGVTDPNVTTQLDAVNNSKNMDELKTNLEALKKELISQKNNLNQADLANNFTNAGSATAAGSALGIDAAMAKVDGWIKAANTPLGMSSIVGLSEQNSVNFGRLSLVSNNGKDIQIEAQNGAGANVTAAIGYDKNVSEKTISLRETNSTIDKDLADAMGFNSEEWMNTGTTIDGLAAEVDHTNGYAAGVMTLKGAQAMMNIAETAQKALEAIRSDLGSVQNQLVSTVNNISVTQVNVKAAESNIRDVDFAEESATFSKHQILAQSGVYAMSQANAVQQNVMRLLQ
ncbi:flagellin [Campylobacter sp. RM5004]|uniref:flagellin N-terminal helical domain-containing protein n=2 Tax=unclassified Campylobacter TaxID=2593542 RepID=UPI0023BAFAF8|nr:flagellin [Campylobacter sp. RM5004]